ncbi:trypsin-like serine protease [Actibacterium sp. MT2.3-13A]|uniref:trypsin-like serine peptidase n=1 Tax=Actibacterium sp. MT2.3-13A TaxID=2828332 RepID=UPI001BA62B8C|nr:trypsin-like serine protease [Actibacterium sp. MT2.3-13A]
MLRKLLIGLVLLAIWAKGSDAGPSDLRALVTGDDGRGWEAVGRLNLGRTGFCTGALIATDRVLTAAHCLYDKASGTILPLDQIEFLAGWRNGRAQAYRGVRHAVVHPRYVFGQGDDVARVAHDLALLELDRPIRLPGIQPFATAGRPRMGDRVGVVSYAQDRSEAPSLQESCRVLAGRAGILMLSCDVDFGSSGAPVFSFAGGVAQIVSVVTAKAEIESGKVALGTSLGKSLDLLQSRLAEGEGVIGRGAPSTIRRFGQGGAEAGGAKFIRP